MRFDVDESLLDASVPEFLLQPLVENALRHGIAKRADGGMVEVAARRDGDALLLTVADNGPGLDPTAPSDGNGLGLANIRERLTTLYGGRGVLTLDARDGGGAVATVQMPFRAGNQP